MEVQVVEERFIDEIRVQKGDKFDKENSKSAIERINNAVGWTQDNEKIFTILETKPTFCYFAKSENGIVGYAVIREDGEDRHLHVSWIATDVLNKGIGTLLMHKIIKKNIKLGNRFLSLHHKNTDKLKYFYEKIATLESLKYSLEESNDGYRVTYEMP